MSVYSKLPDKHDKQRISSKVYEIKKTRMGILLKNKYFL